MRWTGLAAAIALVAGCSSETPSAPSDAGADAADATIDLCASFTDAGDPCAIVSSKPCFPCGTFGGCYCRATGAGPRWTCVTEDACVPGPPIYDDDASPE